MIFLFWQEFVLGIEKMVKLNHSFFNIHHFLKRLIVFTNTLLVLTLTVLMADSTFVFGFGVKETL